MQILWPFDKTFDHLVSGCPELGKTENFHRHNKAAAYIHRNICKGFGIELKDGMSMNPKLSPRRIASPFCGTPMYTDRAIVANRPDIVLKSKKDKTCFLIDMTIVHDTNISITLQKQNLQEGEGDYNCPI